MLGLRMDICLLSDGEHYAHVEKLDDFYTSKNLYASTGFALKFLLSTAFLEFVHALFKLVRSNPMIVFIQCFARLAVIVGVTDIFNEVKLVGPIAKMSYF